SKGGYVASVATRIVPAVLILAGTIALSVLSAAWAEKPGLAFSVEPVWDALVHPAPTASVTAAARAAVICDVLFIGLPGVRARVTRMGFRGRVTRRDCRW